MRTDDRSGLGEFDSDEYGLGEYGFEHWGDGIGAAATVLRANATASGLTAGVPTCPGWTVADLVVHQGMVHRWAADVLRGRTGDGSDHEAAGRAADDLLGWFDEGATEVLDVLSKTPADWDGFFFLKNSPHKRDGWARRQCHETTIHAVDAMSARLGRLPRADEVWFSPALATDGIDELLTGFVPRRSSTLRSAEPLTIAIHATDTDARWTVQVCDDPPVVTRDGQVSPDARWSGAARDLYLLLWNRAGEGEGDGERRIPIDELNEADARALRLWRETMKVAWS